MGHTATGTQAGADRMDGTDHGSVRVITTLKYLLPLSNLGSLWVYEVHTAVSEARVNRRGEETDCSQADKASVKTQSLCFKIRNTIVFRIFIFPVVISHYLIEAPPHPQFTLGAKRSRPRSFIIILSLYLPSTVYFMRTAANRGG